MKLLPRGSDFHIMKRLLHKVMVGAGVGGVEPGGGGGNKEEEEEEKGTRRRMKGERGGGGKKERENVEE